MISQVGTKTVTTIIYSFDLDHNISKIACLKALLRRTTTLVTLTTIQINSKIRRPLETENWGLKTIYFLTAFLPKADNSSEDTAQQKR